MHIPRISIPLCMELIRAYTHTGVKELALLYSRSIINKMKLSLIISHRASWPTKCLYDLQRSYEHSSITRCKNSITGIRVLLLYLKIRCAEEELLQTYKLVGTYQLPGDLHFLFLVCFVFVVFFCLLLLCWMKFHIRISEFQICWPCLQRQGYCV